MLPERPSDPVLEERAQGADPPHPRVKLHVVTGFLGSGKTTLLRRLLEEGLHGERVIVLVNELGDVGIDGALLRRGGHAVVEFTSGCICCQIGGEVLASTLAMIDEFHPDRILIELTGIAEPGRVLSAYTHSHEIMTRARVEPTICVVDAEAFPTLIRELEYGYYCQIQASDIVLLNKTDLVRPESLAEVQEAVQALSPRAFLFSCSRCEVDLDALFSVDGDAWRGVEGATAEGAHGGVGSVHEHAPHGARIFQTLVLRDPDSRFEREHVEDWLKTLPQSLFRLKGTIRLSAGPFFLNWVRDHHDWEPATREDPPPTSLVFVGRDLDGASLESGLASCRRRRARGIRLTPRLPQKD